MYKYVRRAPHHPSPSLRPWDRPVLLGANRWADSNRHGTRIRQRSVLSSHRKRALVRSPSSCVRAALACRRELVAHRGDLHVLRRRGKVREGGRKARALCSSRRSSHRKRSVLTTHTTPNARLEHAERARGRDRVRGALWPEAFVSFRQT